MGTIIYLKRMPSLVFANKESSSGLIGSICEASGSFFNFSFKILTKFFFSSSLILILGSRPCFLDKSSAQNKIFNSSFLFKKSEGKYKEDTPNLLEFSNTLATLCSFGVSLSYLSNCASNSLKTTARATPSY